MRTIEEFAKLVEEENKKHDEELIGLDSKKLIVRAYEIAKWQEIYAYMKYKVIPCLEAGDKQFKDFLKLDIDTPLNEVYVYEFNYGEPQWTTWKGLDGVVSYIFHYLKEGEEQIPLF